VSQASPGARADLGEDEAAWAEVPGIGPNDPMADRADAVTAAGGDAEDRALNQDEIDSLLGVARASGAEEGAGILAIVNSNDISYERLPMLEVVFDRLERLLTTSVRNFTSENVDINLENVTAQRFGDYLNSVPLPAMIAVFRATEWDNFGLITVDSPMIYAIVDVLLGGRRGTLPMRIEGRPYTTIEVSLVERLIHIVLHDLSAAFAPITPVQFRFERMETNPRFAAIARPGNACVVFKLRIDLEDRGGAIEILLPYATLEPARDLLLQMFMGEKFGRDSIWESHLAREIWATEVELEAVLAEQTLSLREVMALEVGSTIALGVPEGAAVLLRCGQVPLLEGRIGRLGETVAIRIERKLDRATERG
jgi:flagellar motor switch protein FliM